MRYEFAGPNAPEVADIVFELGVLLARRDVDVAIIDATPDRSLLQRAGVSDGVRATETVPGLRVVAAPHTDVAPHEIGLVAGVDASCWSGAFPIAVLSRGSEAERWLVDNRPAPSSLQYVALDTPRGLDLEAWRADWRRLPTLVRHAAADENEAEDLVPETVWGGRAALGEYLAWEAIEESTAALILLGEAGAGKSHEVRRLRGATDSVVDLETFDIQRDQLPDAECVWLDELDGLPLSAPFVARLLREWLAERAPARVRVTCRSAAWRSRLGREVEKVLRAHYDALSVFELAPLREADALTVAADRLGQESATRFIDAVRRDLAPLAARPVTLELLLDAYAHDRRLAGDLTTLYGDGIDRMLGDDGKDRVPPLLTVGQRRRIAGAIGWGALLTGRLHVEQSSSGLSLDDICRLSGAARPKVEEVLLLRLFEGAPRRFAHRSFAEFVGAEQAIDMPASKVLDLVLQPVGDQVYLPAHFEGLVGWLLRRSAVFRRLLVRLQPETLVSAGVDLEPETREQLLESLVARHRADVHHIVHLRSGFLSRLTHPKVGKQATRWMADVDASIRRFACRLAGATRQHELAQALLARALSNEEEYPVRVAAIEVIATLARDPRGPSQGPDTAPLASLLASLDFEGFGAEDTDELRGALLDALWPDAIDTVQLFAALRPMRAHWLLGRYYIFLERQDIASRLGPADMAPALAWVTTAAERDAPLERLRTRVVRRAWELAVADEADPGLGRLAEAIGALLERYRHPGVDWSVDPDKTCALVQLLVAARYDPHRLASRLAWAGLVTLMSCWRCKPPWRRRNDSATRSATRCAQSRRS